MRRPWNISLARFYDGMRVNNEPTPEFVGLLEREVPQIVNRIRGHPSLVLLCGDNENESGIAKGKRYLGPIETFNPVGRQLIPQY